MPKNPNIKNISKLEIYNKLDSLEKKIDKEKSKRISNFVVAFIMSSGLAFFIIGVTFLIQLLNDLGGSLLVISISYMGIGVFLLIIGISTYSRIAER